MTKQEAKEAPKLPVKVSLALPSLYRGNGSYTENPKGVRDVQFVMPGSRTKPGEALSLRHWTLFETDCCRSRSAPRRLDGCAPTVP
ncbi:hypothetical protein LZ31DRAFT_177210 [Colletotrichum somersetense]|nr:hypothetical protein LZ31DRAFT_177210 [Colletotrichum somersetense]